MSTLERIRKFALVAALASGAAIAAATQGEELRAGDDYAAGTIANLGHMTVLAQRPVIADLGSMTVTARRLPDIRFADLGAMTVTASRVAETRVADLGGITVTAARSGTVRVAARPSGHSWN